MVIIGGLQRVSIVGWLYGHYRIAGDLASGLDEHGFVEVTAATSIISIAEIRVRPLASVCAMQTIARSNDGAEVVSGGALIECDMRDPVLGSGPTDGAGPILCGCELAGRSVELAIRPSKVIAQSEEQARKDSGAALGPTKNVTQRVISKSALNSSNRQSGANQQTDPHSLRHLCGLFGMADRKKRWDEVGGGL